MNFKNVIFCAMCLAVSFPLYGESISEVEQEIFLDEQGKERKGKERKGKERK